MQLKQTYIRASVLIGFEEIAEDAGVDARQLLVEAGLDPGVLKDPDLMISWRSIAGLWEIAARKLGRPSFGLEATLRSPDHFPAQGPLMLLTHFASTYGEWIELARRYWRYHTDAFTVHLAEDEAAGLVTATYAADSFAIPARQLTECTIGNLVRISRVVVDRSDENPAVVRFQHTRPRDTTLHEQLFRCPIEFDADRTEIVFARKFLSYPTGGSFRLLKPLIGLYLRYRIDRISVYDASVTASVRLLIPTLTGTGRCDMEHMARSLGIETKTLQRRLAAEGTTFSAILEEVREGMAKRLLIESDMSVERIAGLLDYASNPPFTVAFRRWTGITPLAYRKSEREKRALEG